MAVRKAVWHWAWTLAGGVRVEGGTAWPGLPAWLALQIAGLVPEHSQDSTAGKPATESARRRGRALPDSFIGDRMRRTSHIAHRTSNVVKSSWNTFAIHKMKTGSVADRPAELRTHLPHTHACVCLWVCYGSFCCCCCSFCCCCSLTVIRNAQVRA